MTKTSNRPYFTVDDKHGGKASVYFSGDGIHKIIFSDSNGIEFFIEEFEDGTPISLVEQAATDWAVGLRVIA